MDGESLFIYKKIIMIRLIISILLLLTSLLVIVRPPTHFLWMADVAITNFPYVFAGLALLFFVLGLFFRKYRLAILVLSLIACALFSLPIISALSNESKIAAALTAVFPSAKGNELREPFSFADMFTGIGADQV